MTTAEGKLFSHDASRIVSPTTIASPPRSRPSARPGSAVEADPLGRRSEFAHVKRRRGRPRRSAVR